MTVDLSGLDLIIDQDADLFSERSAAFSRDYNYRYVLSRSFPVTGPDCVWIMLNPSTADHRDDDQTIRRVTGYARQWGCSRVQVVNLFAYRSTDPHQLRRVADPVGPINDEILRRVCRPGVLTVAAWGTNGSRDGRAAQVVEMLTAGSVELTCLERTGTGDPRHPLYCRLGLVPVPYPQPVTA